jgi:hypothetical protein
MTETDRLGMDAQFFALIFLALDSALRFVFALSYLTRIVHPSLYIQHALRFRRRGRPSPLKRRLSTLNLVGRASLY